MEKNTVSLKNSSSSSKVSIEILTGGVKFLNFEKKEFQYQREDSILLTHFGSFFRVSQFCTMLHSNLCLKKFSPTNVKLFIEALREEIEPVVGD